MGQGKLPRRRGRGQVNQDTDGSRSTRHFFFEARWCRCPHVPRRRREIGAWTSPMWRRKPRGHPESTGKKSARESRRPGQHDGHPGARRLRLKDPLLPLHRQGRANIVDGFHHDRARHLCQDVRLPGQKCAVFARPAVMAARCLLRRHGREKVPGVIQIVEIPAPSYPMVPAVGESLIADNTLLHPGRGLKITGTMVRTPLTTAGAAARRWRRRRSSLAKSYSDGDFARLASADKRSRPSTTSS